MEPGRIGPSVVDEAHAFLSYTHLDDEGHDGAITELRERLERSVRVVTGDPSFIIFQDHDGIAFGQHWPSRLDEALAGARFLVPVLSPSFFVTDVWGPPCRLADEGDKSELYSSPGECLPPACVAGEGNLEWHYWATFPDDRVPRTGRRPRTRRLALPRSGPVGLMSRPRTSGRR